jgi:SAM-dependent methyltransferase
MGRNAVWLHDHGWKVTAVDRSGEAVGQLRELRPGVDARVVDLEVDASVLQPDSYDLVVCWLYHQRDLYPRIRAAVRQGGLAILCALMQGRFAAESGELRSHFEGWTVLQAEETEKRQVLICQRTK